jgi:hypothetical protein
MGESRSLGFGRDSTDDECQHRNTEAMEAGAEASGRARLGVGSS